MTIQNYFKQSGYKDPSDKTLALAREFEDLKLQIKELKIQLYQKVSVDIDGKEMEVVKAPGAEGLFKDLQRFKKQRDGIQKKLDMIESFAAERETFSCPSEAMQAEREQMVAKANLILQANTLCDRTKRQFKSQIPDLISRAIDEDPDLCDPEDQLRLGIILTSKKLSKMKLEIDQRQKQINNWRVCKDQILEFIDRICPDDIQ